MVIATLWLMSVAQAAFPSKPPPEGFGRVCVARPPRASFSSIAIDVSINDTEVGSVRNRRWLCVYVEAGPVSIKAMEGDYSAGMQWCLVANGGCLSLPSTVQTLNYEGGGGKISTRVEAGDTLVLEARLRGRPSRVELTEQSVQWARTQYLDPVRASDQLVEVIRQPPPLVRKRTVASDSSPGSTASPAPAEDAVDPGIFDPYEGE